MDRAERVAGELMRHTPDSYDSRGERQTAIAAILRREFQAVWEEAAEDVERDDALYNGPYGENIADLIAGVLQSKAAALRARAKEEA